MGSMTVKVNPSAFRKDVYGFIKQVSATGEPVEIQTKQGEVLQLARVHSGDRFASIVPMESLMLVDPEDLVSEDWSADWDADAAVSP